MHALQRGGPSRPCAHTSGASNARARLRSTARPTCRAGCAPLLPRSDGVVGAGGRRIRDGSATPRRRDPVCSASTSEQLHNDGNVDTQTTPSVGKGWIVRQATLDDVRQVSALCARVFADDTTEGMKEAAPYMTSWLDFIQDWYMASIDKELRFQLRKTLEGKMLATRDAKSFQLRYEILEAQSKKTLGRFSSTAAARNLKRLIQKKSQQRMFCCLVAQNRETGKIVGSVTVSMQAPEAQLPPPFPAMGVPKFYIGNMVVDKSFRRKGIATDLLASCEQLAKRWNSDSMWLHVGVDSPPAQRLYRNLGYRQRGVDPWWIVLERRYLFCKVLDLPKNSRFRRFQGGGDNGVGSGEGSNGSSNAATQQEPEA